MAVVKVILPAFGQTTDEGRLVSWLKSEGDYVARGEPLAEVETDKATTQVEALSSGFLRRILQPAPPSRPANSLR